MLCAVKSESMNKNFSQENIDELNKQQNLGQMHPYTCSGHGIKECKRELSYEARRNGEEVEYTNENEGVLIATERGWICPCGKYTQDWFH